MMDLKKINKFFKEFEITEGLIFDQYDLKLIRNQELDFEKALINYHESYPSFKLDDALEQAKELGLKTYMFVGGDLAEFDSETSLISLKFNISDKVFGFEHTYYSYIDSVMDKEIFEVVPTTEIVYKKK